MNQIELRKAITLLELQDRFKGIEDIQYDSNQNCYWVHNIGYESWPLLNPIEDKALLFDLMIKYEIDIDYNYSSVVIFGGYPITVPPISVEYETEADIPEAILRCILKSKE